jgi:hypothetical protein
MGRPPERAARSLTETRIPAQGLHPVVGYLVGWGYALITGLVGPIVNLLIGYFVGTILHQEFGWPFKPMWIVRRHPERIRDMGKVFE